MTQDNIPRLTDEQNRALADLVLRLERESGKVFIVLVVPAPDEQGRIRRAGCEFFTRFEPDIAQMIMADVAEWSAESLPGIPASH